ncbi:T9SS type A sorting domain-containing protein [Segetibacter sp. 3557_3]|uniref:PQQ-dependent sugar dehydrogenase n=1 Tax=Segetibacter sp. 3557_3 TaxID=2547429 RepID=UPI001058D9B4|nr:PQQ-dependent sugar dehydrogenase [Segetibacter sp. 3557_3]TDH20061.1 T9SS type A sorting domain-containing protein [Segetibacter sp. 3557_3]
MNKISTVVIFSVVCFFTFTGNAQTVTGPLGETFTYRVVANSLSDPWEITYGPDNYLWVTEAKGYKVSRINPATGSKTILVDLTSMRNFGTGGSPQGGLMGLALHPQLLTGKPYVYLAYVYSFSGCVTNDGGCFYKTKIVRYNYNSTAQILTSPVTLVDTIPGSNDHNGGRLAIAPVNGINYLFYGVGEMGAGQFNNAGRKNNAQDPNVYEGKILRFNLESDKDKGFDQWLPNDNPYITGGAGNGKNNGRQSAVWSLGHRNPQGLGTGVFSGVTRLFSTEHGPFSDDELNIIERRSNYGHPLIVGMNDGNYNGLAAAASTNTTLSGMWQTSCPLITSENANSTSIGPEYKNPIKTFYPSTNTYLNTILTAVKNSNTATGYPNGNSETWESEAVSNVMHYSSYAIPGWNNSLLITTLKGGKLIRLKLSSSGDAVVGDTINYFKAANRYRDLAISPDGNKIYLAVDSSLITSGPSANNPQVNTNRGSILEFTYVSNPPMARLLGFAATTYATSNNFYIYPNPAKDWLSVTSNSRHVGVMKYQLTDITGKLFFEGRGDGKKVRINIRELSGGIYILKVGSNEAKWLEIHKFIKQ